MKIVIAYGGLGNQMFQYALVCAYRQRGVKACLFVSSTNLEHHGYEVEKIFPAASQWRTLNCVQRNYYRCLQWLRNCGNKRHHLPNALLFFPFGRVDFFQDAIAFHPEVFQRLEQSNFYVGQFQSYKFFEQCADQVRREYTFDTALLSEQTRQAAVQMASCNSVSLHVRRGDYMNGFYYQMLGSVCNLDYYRRAMDEMQRRQGNVRFFIFSDDMDYVRENLPVDRAVCVDWNTGTDSWQDMYLMSQCRHNIIANSTFSWWGAWLNANPDKTVIAPKPWFAGVTEDDIVPEQWVRL